MPYFNAKLHQKSILAGALQQTPLGELTALPHTRLLDLRGPTCKGREGRVKRKGREAEGEGCWGMDAPECRLVFQCQRRNR